MLYLVTGGAGFIGSHLVDALLEAGHSVRVLDDLSTGSTQNLSAHRANAALAFLNGSILDRATVDAAVEGTDGVFHLAAAVGVNQIVGSPVRSIVTNSTGTHNVLEACSTRQTPVLITSTSEVYGKSAKELFAEDDDLVLGPTSRSRWSYAASKALDEFLALAYLKERGVPVFLTRLFNTVGPRQSGRYGMVVPRFVAQALAGEPLTVYGDGSQTRSFCHVLDVVPSLIRFMESSTLSGQVINLGGQEEIAIAALAQRVVDLLGSSSELQFIPYDDAYDIGFEDMLRRCPDTTRATTLLGFRQQRSLEDILLDVAEDQRSRPPVV